MKIHLYTFGWNEMPMLGFFFRHYEPFVDRFFFFDDGSDDGTVEYLRRKPNVEVRQFTYSDPLSFSRSAGSFRENCWRESRATADWVLLPDVDEHLCHRNIRHYLRRCRDRGITVVPALGFEMISDQFPHPDERLARQRMRGSPDVMYSKLRVFNPAAVETLGFGDGAHRSEPRGRIVLPRRDELTLLHYKHLGRDYVRGRHKALGARLRSTDVAHRWGAQYLFDESEYQADLERLTARIVDLADPAFNPARDHREERWWRKPGAVVSSRRPGPSLWQQPRHWFRRRSPRA